MIKGQHTCVENPNLPGKSRLPTGCYGSCLHLFKVAIYAARSATSFLDMLGIFWMWIEQEQRDLWRRQSRAFSRPKEQLTPLALLLASTVSPRLTVQVPFGPSNTAVPLVTSRSILPSIFVGLVSGTGACLAKVSEDCNDAFDLTGFSNVATLTDLCSCFAADCSRL
jgi:hypothetical protein